MQRRGFTIIEVMIVIVMITVLTLLGIANLRNTQIVARDDERQAKAEAIARSLEAYYLSGDTARGKTPGQYPSVLDVTNAVNGGYFYNWLRGIDEATLQFSWKDPGESNLMAIGDSTSPYANENDSTINNALLSGKIVYEPIRASPGVSPLTDSDDWAPCYASTHTCQRFNLYYKRESDGQRVTIRSLRQ